MSTYEYTGEPIRVYVEWVSGYLDGHDRQTLVNSVRTQTASMLSDPWEVAENKIQVVLIELGRESDATHPIWVRMELSHPFDVKAADPKYATALAEALVASHTFTLCGRMRRSLIGVRLSAVHEEQYGLGTAVVVEQKE